MVLWWIGNAVLLVAVIPLVVVLANHVIRLAREASRYADEILAHGILITANLDPLPALAQTRAHVSDVKERAVAYVGALERLTAR